MKTISTFITVAALALLIGCASISVNLPAVTEQPTGERLPGKIIWRDLLTHEPEAVRRFYGELFGWEFEQLSSNFGFGQTANYSLIRHRGELIGGMIDLNRLETREADKASLSQWVVLMSVADIDAAVTAVEQAGGKVLTPPTAMMERGRLALIEDDQGAALALVESRDGDPVDRAPPLGGFLWDELWTGDVEQATVFYQQLADFRAGNQPVDDQRSYRYLKTGERARVGIMERPAPTIDPVWVTYIRVADPAAVTARVTELGGRVLLPPEERDLGGQVALVLDPSGAGVALQTWEPSASRMSAVTDATTE
ncbi:MAG: VOC family protein [Gammaproteobacteria bacterium]|nr:VOC family protein [Gammaproteobacteria bacterium]